MTWAGIILALLKLAGTLADYASRRQLLSAGQAEAIAQGLQANLDAISQARRASDAVEHPASPGDADYASRVRRRFTRPD